MCGINGFVLLKKERTQSELDLIKFIFQEGFRNSLPRGKDATGIVVFDRNGYWFTHKAPLQVDDYLDKYWEEEISHKITHDTGIVLGHVRAYTQGTPSNNDNNHPIITGNIIGVHNGGVQNDYSLFKQFGFKRIGEVDSEIIFHLIDMYNSEAITYEGLKQALETSELRMVGTFAFANVNETTKLWVVKQQDRPFSLIYWDELGVIFFNSISSYVNEPIDFIKRMDQSLLKTGMGFTTATVEIKDNQVFMLDSSGGTLEECITNPQKITILKSNTYSSSVRTTTTTTTTTTTKQSDKNTGGANTITPASNDKKDDKEDTTTIEELTIPECEFCDEPGVLNCKSCKELKRLGSNNEPVHPVCFECGKELDMVELEHEYNINNPETPLCDKCGQTVLINYSIGSI